MNKGHSYEDKINQILRDKRFLKKDFISAGSSAFDPDSIFLHKGSEYKLEIKSNGADYCQQTILWDETNGWHWSEENIVTGLFDDLNVLDGINFEPNKYRLDNNQITLEMKKYDQKMINNSNNEADNQILFEYYRKKGVYYIQIENFGFFYLSEDIANLGVDQFNGKLFWRTRGKTHNRNSYLINDKKVTKKKYLEERDNENKEKRETPWDYSFFCILKLNSKNDNYSKFNIEDSEKHQFPPFKF